MSKRKSAARQARRIAARYGEVPIEVFYLGDGTYEFVFAPSPCDCARCEMLRLLHPQKSDGPPSATATHQFELLDWAEVRRDKAI